MGVISGPTFADEVARALPTALSVAATSPGVAQAAAQLLRADTLRAYESDDITGVETGGAVKNVLAIAAGASYGLGFGHNARAALVTRDLLEHLRGGGMVTGGPPPFDRKDRSRFLDGLEASIRAARSASSRSALR